MGVVMKSYGLAYSTSVLSEACINNLGKEGDSNLVGIKKRCK